ncbi:MAG: acyltransferase [Chitinophagaceae bacterium]
MSESPSLRETSARSYGLDVVRAGAVLIILFSHSLELLHVYIPFFWIGTYSGVDLFFSLSGFLIGRILITLFNQPDPSISLIKSFWRRRWLRTLPLYFIVLSANIIISLITWPAFRIDWTYFVFLQNFHNNPYFFGESWSLGIEEWFYFLVPLFGLVYYRVRRLTNTGVTGQFVILNVALIIIILFNLLRFARAGQFPVQAILYRYDAIAYGLIAACLSKSDILKTRKYSLLMLCLGSICWGGGFIFSIKAGEELFRTLYFPLTGAGTALIVLGLYFYRYKKTFPIITQVSKISYSIYLLHLTLFIRPLSGWTGTLPLAQRYLVWLGVLAVVFLLSSLSYLYIESYFLGLRDKRITKEFGPALKKLPEYPETRI